MAPENISVSMIRWQAKAWSPYLKLVYVRGCLFDIGFLMALVLSGYRPITVFKLFALRFSVFGVSTNTIRKRLMTWSGRKPYSR